MFLGLNMKNAGMAGALRFFMGLKQVFTTGGSSGLNRPIPIGATQLVGKAWGAGGLGPVDDGASLGGGGGFVTATFLIAAGYTFDYWVGANSGGLSGIRLKNSNGATVGWLLSPGGGMGGAGGNAESGGAGGTAVGGDGGTIEGGGGTGATVGAAGTGGAGSGGQNAGSNGTGPFTTSQVFNGGAGGAAVHFGGDGGGGNYGGGGGGAGGTFGGGGGAGSLYVEGHVSTSSQNGTGLTPGNITDPDYVNPAGYGGNGAAGNPGRLVLIWS